MKNYIIKIVLALNFITSSVPLLAMPGDPPGEGDPPFEDPMPVDNYLLVLVLVAIMLGTYWIYRKKWKTA